MDLADVGAASIVRTAGARRIDHPFRQAASEGVAARTTTPSPVHAGATASSVR
jgi:hypothetical protein